ncbi:hypothetical protein A5698_09655 [Mycobacterium sp. E136]|uniref:DUF998 domain-containing protein n=1 Tax=Mycobacterium sp. E136 TaxID=1834125 RepID=UPI0007FE228D|nr:DUF998 domain-containing protein [Mycobacterium sp. E136]OBH00047.1 hypothetical protein A5698_09655 [Mycobacterium sp. E136]
MSRRTRRKQTAQILAGAAAGPAFVTAYTVIGATRRGYDWRRYPVSSLAVGRHGWRQRVNFVSAGTLYLCAAEGLWRSDRHRIGPRAVPAIVAAVGVGLVGSGLFVTDYVGNLLNDDGTDTDNPPFAAGVRPRTPAGRLHDLFGIPVFVGIPVAAMASAASAARSGNHRWTCYSAASSAAMTGSLILFGVAIGGRWGLGGKSGVLQRVSIATGLGWLSSLSLRALSG